MSEKPRKRAGIYLRISKDTDKQGYAIDRQREDCQLICKINNYEIIDEYTDQSISAYTSKRRPAYDRMIRDYRSGKIEVIVAWKLDRLSRSQLGFMDMVKELQAQGLTINTTDLGELDLTSEFSLILANMAVGMAQFESRRKSERMIRANEQRAKQGRRKHGYHTYGYTLDYEIIPENARVIQEIYQAVAKGHSLNSIARALSGETEIQGIHKAPKPGYVRIQLINQQRRQRKQPLKPMPEYGPWERTTLTHILRNPFYAGYSTRMPWTEWQKRQTRRRMKDFIVTDNNGNPIKATDHEPIIDEALWLKVQDILDNPERSKNYCGNNRKYLGTGVYRCSICGKPLTCSRHSYECKGHLSRRGAQIDKLVTAVIETRLSTDQDLIEAFKRRTQPNVKAITDQIDTLTARIGRATTLLLDLEPQDIAYSVTRKQIDQMQTQVNQLKDQRSEMLEDNAIDILATSDDIVEAFRGLPIKKKAEIVDLLMTVTLDKRPRGQRMYKIGEGVHIQWK